jgi:hypothetical protein
MRNAYKPLIHWTSRLRSRVDLMPYESDDITRSSFTIKDVTGTFTNLLVRNGCSIATSWHQYPTYHIEVNTSEGGLQSMFCLDPHQVNKVGLNMTTTVLSPVSWRFSAYQ